MTGDEQRDAAQPHLHVEVDEHLCQGLGYCQSLCPKVFVVDDDRGVATVLQPVVDRTLADSVIKAEEACPTRAIGIWYDKPKQGSSE